MKPIQTTLAAALCSAATAATIGFAGPASADPATCDPQALTVGSSRGQSGLGHRSMQLTFTLQPGAAACQLTGYPTVDALADSAAPIHAAQTPSGYLASATPVTTVTLTPGQGAHAIVEWVAAAGGQDKACQIYGDTPPDMTLRVTPPGSSQTFDVPIKAGRNEGLCNLLVHPLIAG
jgi:Protein of unknown function (DUF4232)